MKRNESGSTLVVALSVIATLVVCVGVALEYTQNVNRNVQRSDAMQAAQDIGDGVLEAAFANWRQICRDPTIGPTPPTSKFSSISVPGSSAFPGATYTLSTFSVKAVDPQLNAVATTASPPPSTGLNPGTNSCFYLASADVTVPTSSGSITQKMRRVFEQQSISAVAVGNLLQ